MKEEKGISNRKQLNFDVPSYEDIVWLKKLGVDVPLTYDEYKTLNGEYKQTFNNLVRRELQGDTQDDPNRSIGDEFRDIQRPNISDEEIERRIKDFQEEYSKPFSYNLDDEGNKVRDYDADKAKREAEKNNPLKTFLFVKMSIRYPKNPSKNEEQEVTKEFPLTELEKQIMKRVDSEHPESGSEAHLYRFSKEALKKLNTTMNNLMAKWNIKKEDFVNLGTSSTVNNGKEENYGIPEKIRKVDPNALGYVYSDSVGNKKKRHDIAPRGKGAADKDPNDRDYYYGDKKFLNPETGKEEPVSNPDKIRFIEFLMYNAKHEARGVDRSDELVRLVFPNGEDTFNEEQESEQSVGANPEK